MDHCFKVILYNDDEYYNIEQKRGNNTPLLNSIIVCFLSMLVKLIDNTFLW